MRKVPTQQYQQQYQHCGWLRTSQNDTGTRKFKENLYNNNNLFVKKNNVKGYL